jgi:hypothetical protein
MVEMAWVKDVSFFLNCIVYMCWRYANAAVVKIHQAMKSRLFSTRIFSYALVYLYVLCQFLYRQPNR